MSEFSLDWRQSTVLRTNVKNPSPNDLPMSELVSDPLYGNCTSTDAANFDTLIVDGYVNDLEIIAEGTLITVGTRAAPWKV